MSSTFIWAMTTSSLRDARDEARLDRQFGGGQRQRFFRGLHGHAVDFENYAAGLDPRYPQFRRALAGAHAHLGGLLGHRHVWENPDPDPDFPKSEEHTSELQSQSNLVCRLLLEKNNAPHPQVVAHVDR